MNSNQMISNERLAEIAEDGFLQHGDSKAMAAELLTLRKATAWVGVDAGMPKDETVVLVRDEKDIIWCAEVDHGQFYPDEFHRIEGCREITHWMELPKPPAPEPE